MLRLREMSVTFPFKKYHTRVPHCMKRHVQVSPGNVYRKSTIDVHADTLKFSV